MRRIISIVVGFCLLFSVQASFAATGGEKGPGDRAYERANDNASFLRENAKKEKKEKKEKAEKKTKNEKKSREENAEKEMNKLREKKQHAEREMAEERERHMENKKKGDDQMNAEKSGGAWELKQRVEEETKTTIPETE